MNTPHASYPIERLCSSLKRKRAAPNWRSVASGSWTWRRLIVCLPLIISRHLLNDSGIVEGRAEAGVLETQSQRW